MRGFQREISLCQQVAVRVGSILNPPLPVDSLGLPTHPTTGVSVDILEISEELLATKGALRVIPVVGFMVNLNGVINSWNVGIEEHKILIPK